MSKCEERALEPVEGVTDLERVVTAAPQTADDVEKHNGLVAIDTSASERLPFSKARCVALVTTIAAAPFLSTMAVQASVIILPTIGEELNIPVSRQQWIISAYNLTFGCFLLLWGRLADVYGRRMIFLWGSAAFTLTSIITPFIPNEIGFDIFRGLQGLAAAAMAPTALGILASTFPPGKTKDIAFGCFGAGAPLGGVLGNIFGGVVGEYLDWQWVFWLFGIIAGISTVASYFVIPIPPLKPEPVLRNTVDWIGGSLITIGLVVLVFALSEGNVVGWSTPWVPVLIVLSLIIIGAFGFWQHYLEHKTERRPLMKMSIFKNGNFTAANVLMALFFSSFNNYLIFATYWFQDYQGLSVIQTTLRFLPTGITGILVATITGQILSRIPGDYILTFSTICMSISSLLFAIPIPVHTTYWAYGFPAMVLCVSGADTMFPVLTLFVAKTLPPEDASLGGALITAVGQIGRAIGLAIATAVQTAVVAREKGLRVDEIGGEGHKTEPWDNALKVGIRTTAWFNFGMSVASTAVVIFFIRGIGIIGGKGKR
ncbi:major facilitator superfamily domain-containing protein [Alternaria rosae]|uniref:major facilitator superfamily domain-containing protein n=1 Tax=Alternaria rosae TaxID=1187941 RepID=UPI001E8E5413|nr:major facilitator superfamily domain-containing protein [Alternaria rosae]KAH6881276.1 major facilitator superfamily domain-containing protein [Alternaria rosae]